MEDDLNIFFNGRRPQFSLKEDDHNFCENGRQPTKIMLPKINKSKNNNIFKNERRPNFF